MEGRIFRGILERRQTEPGSEWIRFWICATERLHAQRRNVVAQHEIMDATSGLPQMTQQM
jgi:hypothetical protein